MQDKIRKNISNALEAIFINNFEIIIENVSHKHAGHFTGDGYSHFIITVKSVELLAKKPLERHRILNDATAKFMETVHSISFRFL